jgi:hypothetical protein
MTMGDLATVPQSTMTPTLGGFFHAVLSHEKDKKCVYECALCKGVSLKGLATQRSR